MNKQPSKLNLRSNDTVYYLYYKKGSKKLVEAKVIKKRNVRKNSDPVIIIGSPMYIALNSTAVGKSVSLPIRQNFKLRVELVEIKRRESRWYTITQRILRFLKMKA